MDSSLLNSLKYLQTEEELAEGVHSSLILYSNLFGHYYLLCIDSETNKGASWCFDQVALQKYLIGACQDDYGGMIDKPGKRR